MQWPSASVAARAPLTLTCRQRVQSLTGMSAATLGLSFRTNDLTGLPLGRFELGVRWRRKWIWNVTGRPEICYRSRFTW